MCYLKIQLFWLRAKVQFFCNINKKKLHKNRLTVFMIVRSLRSLGFGCFVGVKPFPLIVWRSKDGD